MAEKSGKIFLMDRILAIESVVLEKYNLQQIKEIFEDHLNDIWRENVTLTMESSHAMNVSYRCPYCNIENILSQNDEKKLKNIYHEIIFDYSYEDVWCDLKNSKSPKNRENDEDPIRKIRDNLAEKLLCQCTSCQNNCTAFHLFENKILI